MQVIPPPSVRFAEHPTAEATPGRSRPPGGTAPDGPNAAANASKDGAHAASGRQRGASENVLSYLSDGDPRPIGVFDSGVGGLTVVRALRAALPHESIVYLGDTARVPYGLRSADVVRRYALGCARFLLAQDAKMVVVACNTASAHALGALQEALTVPVCGVVEAGAREVTQVRRRGHLAVLATEGTVASGAYPRALAELAPALRITQVACPLFVPLCEEGLVDHPATRLLAADYLGTLQGDDVDAALLGCTHYPLLAPLLQRLLGPKVRLFDSATAAAHDVQRVLAEHRLSAARGGGPEQALTLFATDVTERLRRVAASFLSGPVPLVQLVDLPAGGVLG